ncbi:MAG: PAS domain-containing protein [Acidobacteria bacterium]|nr:PAS domain-containing protein [Acidobacteriota bacterium]
MRKPKRLGRKVFVPGLLLAWMLLASHSTVLALDPSLEVGQYAHTSWTARDGYSLGAVFAMAQTPDGYLWLGGEYGLFRFDGVSFTQWQPPAGRQLPDKPYSLLVTRDGTLWIGTFAGLASWGGGKLTQYPELNGKFVTSLLEDREGTVWAGILGGSPGTPTGRLCSVRSGGVQCYGEDGAFGSFVWSMSEDGTGVLWASAESGLWRWKPGPPKRYEMPGVRLGNLSHADDGRLLIGVSSAGLRQVAGDKVEPYPIHSPTNRDALLPDREVDSNKLLCDRDGGLWIGTHGRGLIHVRNGRTDVLTKADGLSGDISCSLFEDREGNVWYASSRGLDRFRELPVTTISAKQGLSSDATKSVLAAADGSVWVATHDGLNRWKDGQFTVFRKASGLPDDEARSLFQDYRGRIWVSTNHGLAYFENGKFVAVGGVPNEEVYSITGDEAGNLWLSGNKGLSHLLDGRLVERFPWSALGRQQQAKVILSDRGGLWLSFWTDGGVLYFKDGQVRASYTAAEGLGKGHVPGLLLDRDGAVWAATEEGGLSRIKDGRVTTLTSRNGLPCDTIHWASEDDDGALWLYTACGLVRMVRGELDAWVADPQRRVETTVWDAGDGVILRAISPAYYNPPVAKSADGKLWFMPGESVQVVDPRHLPVNRIPPPVYVEQVTADGQTYDAAQGLRLPAGVHDLLFDFTALSLVAPENVPFRVKLEGQDKDWRELVNQHHVHYTNLPPGNYRFRVTAANNSGVWNEEGALLDFSIDPAFYQTTWFRVLCALTFLALLWAAYRLRVRQLEQRERKFREAIETMPAMAFITKPDGYRTFVNRRWLDYTGLGVEQAVGLGWQAAVHPEDLERVRDRWRASLATGEPLELELRFRRAADGQYRWFLTRAVPLRDKGGKIVKWYGVTTDIEDRKRAEEERERLRRLEDELKHTNRLNMLGELTSSIAHEINQPLAAAITSAGACLRWLERDRPEVERARETVRRIEDDGRRAAEIITRLKSFYRKDTSPRREAVSVNELVGEMLVLLRGEADRHSVALRTELAAELPAVWGDRVQLQQVLMNLMLNAVEAMSETGGELTVRTRGGDGGVLVSVSDTGVGLPAGKTEQIFDAFYTTKGAGTGMGLAISRTIIESHGGRLWAEANNGRGASFHFTLPTPINDIPNATS